MKLLNGVIQRWGKKLLSVRLSYKQKTLAASGLLLVFLFGLIGLNYYSDRQNQILFNRDFHDLSQRLDFQLNGYNYVLNTFSSFINAQEEISLEEMNRFCNSIDFSILKGIDLITFAKRVNYSNAESFEKAMNLFVPGFKIKPRPTDSKQDYYPITFIYNPNSKTKAISDKLYGKDISIRTNTFQKAVNAGHIISSGELITDLSNKEPGLPARLAVYDRDLPHHTIEEKQRAVIGSLGVGFKFNTLINQVLSSYIRQQMYVEIYNKASNKLVFQSEQENIDQYKKNEILKETIHFAEVPWEIRGYNKNNYLEQGYLLMFTLIGIICVLSFYIVYLFLERRSRKLEADMVKQMQNTELAVASNKILQEEINLKEQFLKDRAYFFAQITHELKSPLNAILGFNELIRTKIHAEEVNRAKIEEYVSKSVQALNRQLALINSILDISKMTESCMTYIKENRSMITTIESHLPELNMLGVSRNTKVRLDVKSDIPMFEYDDFRWKQVFSNLVSNAVKFSPKNSEVVISLYADDTKMIIQVIDQGQGIPNGQEEKIFLVFMQSSVNEKDFKSGTGLGLPLVKEIVKAHKGTIVAKNNSHGVGAVFTIEIDLTANQK